MHILRDENGNICAGDQHHEHSTNHKADHNLTENKNKALLSYMYEHNVHHTQELLETAEALKKAGHHGVAEEVEKAVAKFQEGNEHLHRALHTI